MTIYKYVCITFEYQLAMQLLKDLEDMVQTQFLATFSDIENGVMSYITMGVHKGLVNYVSVLRDTDAEENICVKFYPVDKFDFNFVSEETNKMIS